MNGGPKRTIAIVAGALVAGLLLGVVVSAPRARANAMGDFFDNLLAPLGIAPAAPGSEGGGANGSSTASLYQPTVNYENAVVNAVKTASPAVVSIVISKNVPIMEQCPYNPLGDLPPEFQQFFGNDFQGLTQPCNSSGQTQLQQIGGGSGFIISSDGLILTNKHVISDAGASYTVITNDGKKYDAKVLARDPNQDIAVVKIGATGLPTVSLGNSDGLELGQTAIAIGNALGQFSNTVSVGVISGLSRTVTASGGLGGGQETIRGVVQTDAAINPGNSGGPLLNLAGEVIGVNTAIASGAENIGFAIPINQARHDIQSVEATGEIQAPYLGVRYETVTQDLAAQQGLTVSHGALLRGDQSGPAVVSGSPAAKAGLQAEDIILSVNGVALDANHDLAAIVANHNVGDVLTLAVQRGQNQITVTVTLAQRPAGS